MVHGGAYRDCSWYFGQAHADAGHRGQSYEPSIGGSTDMLERMSAIADRSTVPQLRRITAVLVQLPGDVQRDLQRAFEPFGIERTWLTLQKAFMRDGLNVLPIAERSAEAHDECRAAHETDAPLEPIMVRDWFASVLRNHYKNHTGELPRSHVLTHHVDAAAKRVRACLAMYELASRGQHDARDWTGAHTLPGEAA